MHYRYLTGIMAVAAMLSMSGGAPAFDDAKYPDLKGQWRRVARDTGAARVIQYDPSKPRGLAQEAPLTPEYQAILEANLADQAQGGQGNDPTFTCLSPGMPRMMIAYAPDGDRGHAGHHLHPDRAHPRQSPHLHRRTRLPGRRSSSRASRAIPSANGSTRTATAATTRSWSRPAASRVRAPTTRAGIPLHEDNQTIVKERIYLDKSQSQPAARRDHHHRPRADAALDGDQELPARPDHQADLWREYVCAENNVHVSIGNETYFLSADGLLMPAKKDQPPPDLRYFKQTRK